MAGSRKTEYEIAMLVGGQVQASFGNSVHTVNSGFDSMVNMASSAAKMVTAAFASVKIGQFVSDAIETYSGFEQSMANTAATANATQQQYNQLEAAAREMGKATTKTAAEASDALGYMMLAGWDVNDSIAGLEPVLRLSEATQMDLATCSDLVTDSMSALGLSVEDLGEYLDICTMANNSANTSAQALMEAFIGCGGAARSIGESLGDSQKVINDTATALGVLANNGVKGTEAGTAMNAILVRITSKDVAMSAMRKLGVSAFDAAGNFRGLQEVLVDLHAAMADMDGETKSAYMSDIAGTNYYTKMGYLVDAVGESVDGVQSAWDSLSGKLGQADGALLRMAERVTDTMDGARARLESAVDDAKISFADTFADDLKYIINSMAGFIPELTQNFTDFSVKAGPKISKAFQKIANGAGEAWDVISGMGGWVIDNFDMVEKVIAGVGGAIITYKVISGLAGIASTIKDIGSALKTAAITNPWLMGITIAATAIAGVVSIMKTAEEQAVRSNLEAHFGDIALSMEDLSQAAEHIVMSDSLGQVQESLAAFGELDGIQRSMQDSINSINKMNWKVSIGMQLSMDEMDSYQAEIDNYIAQAQDYVLQQQYALNIDLAAFAEGDSKRQELVGKINSFFSDTHGEMQRIGAELSEAMMSAFADGVLIPEEAETIANLQAQMARIQEAVATSDFDAKLDIMELEMSGGNLSADSYQALQDEIREEAAAASEQYKESLAREISAAKQSYAAGKLSNDEYDEFVVAAWQEYLDRETEMEAKVANFQLDTVLQQYGDELEPAIHDYRHKIEDVIEEYGGDENTGDWMGRSALMWDSMMRSLNENALDETTQKAIGSLIEDLEPSLKRMEELKAQYEGDGAEAPKALIEFISDIQTLKALAEGSEESIYYVLGQEMANNEYFQELQDVMIENGSYMPEAWSEGMGSNTNETVLPAIERLYTSVDGHMQEVFSKSIHVPVNVELDMEVDYMSGRPGLRQFAAQNLGLSEEQRNIPKSTGNFEQGIGESGILKHISIGGHAEGGIFNIPHIAWFAEDGPEAAIPIDGSSNAVSLWEQVGRLLGVFDGGVEKSQGEELYHEISGVQSSNSSNIENSDSWQFVFSPQVTIEGNADREKVEGVLQHVMGQLREIIPEMMEEYSKERGRRSFAR